MSNLFMNEIFLQLTVPLLGGLLITFMTWRLNQTLSRGRPMSPFTKKLVSHGFLFVTGMAYLIAWDTQLAAFLGFPGREVWRPLTVLWGGLLLYDAGRRLRREQQITETLEALERVENPDRPESVPPSALSSFGQSASTLGIVVCSVAAAIDWNNVLRKQGHAGIALLLTTAIICLIFLAGRERLNSIVTAVRFLFFFAVLGAIAKPSTAAFVVVASRLCL
jgi:hypothetical protein